MSSLSDVTLTVTADTSGASSAMARLQSRAVDMKKALEPTASAASGLASALGGISGQGGAALGALSNLTGAFLAGGPLLVGIAAVTTGVVVVAEKFFSLRTEAEDLVESFNKLEQSVSDKERGAAASIRLMSAELKALEQGAKDASEAVDKMTLVNAQIALADATLKERDARQANLDAIEAERGTILGRLFEIGEESEARNKAHDELINAIAERKKAQIDLEETEKRIELASARRAKSSEEKPQKKRTASGTRKTSVVGALDDSEGEMYEAQASLLARLRDEAEAEGARRREAERAAEKEHADEVARIKVDAERAAAERKKEILDEEMAYRREAIDFSTSLVLSATATAIEAAQQMAAGQDVAIEELALSFVKATGMQVMGIGAKYFAEGLGLSLVPGGQANGIALMGVGAGIFAGGTAMAATGAVSLGMIQGQKNGTAAGGGAGGATGSLSRSSFGPRGDSGAPRVEQGSITMVIQGGTVVGDPTTSARTLSQIRARSLRQAWQPGA